MVKSQAYYDELFETLVQYGEFNPDEMLSDDDLREQLRATLKNKYSDTLFNRMKTTSKFEQKTMDNYDKKITDLEKQEDYTLTPQQRRDIIDRGLAEKDLIKEFKQKKKTIRTPRIFNLKGVSKGKPVMVRKEIIKIKGISVIKYRDEKGRFAKYSK